MLYFKMKGDKVTEVSSKHQRSFADWKNRNDFKTFEQAEKVAASANLLGKFEGGELIATDAGPNVSPRYDVIRLPTVGDKVSYSFNGDSYPDGEIHSISALHTKVVTTTGSAYYRRRKTGAWLKDNTWFLVQGHEYKQNPSF